MKDTLKYIAIVFVAAVALIIFLRGCPETSTEVKVITPADTNFSPIVQRDYRPKSIPLLEHPKKPPVRLPRELPERDVKRVLIIAGKGCLDSVKIIETKDGRIFVDRQDGKIASAEVVDYQPPILSFGLNPLAGVSISPAGDPLLSPMLGLNLVVWWGKVQLPNLGADLRGVSLSASYRYDNYSLGAGRRWCYDGDKQIIFFAAINF
jgi:hypothetical protein